MEQQSIEDPAEIGSYFVANYPPFSAWSREQLPSVQMTLDAPPASNGASAAPAPLGLYLHVPFCRKRCKFCYFRVYTGRNSADVNRYLDALAAEVAIYARQPRLAGRQFDFVYFGGGTPSFLSNDQLRSLVDRINEHWQWDAAREVTFECEPGTLTKSKLETIKSIGVTRLSLGVEHFDDDILVQNGRAHKSAEILRSYEWARAVGFDQVNIDLIAGMVGETDDKWRATVDQALALDPDSLTLYQMELPYNSVFARESTDSGAALVADWPTRRRWAGYAFDVFERAGYEVSSAYTLVKPNRGYTFVYRDALWHGMDMVGTGVASFSYMDGMHYQNCDDWDDYIDPLEANRLPLARALRATDHQRLIREMTLQLKLGRLDGGYFREKFGVQVQDVFADAFASLTEEGFASIDGDRVTLTRDGLMCVDGLLPRFFEPQFRDVRYS